MTDTWTHRDLPVLEAIVTLADQNGGGGVTKWQILNETGMDPATVDTALIALRGENPPFFTARTMANGSIWYVSNVTGHARRAVRAWPTPDSLADVLRAALEQAEANEPDPEKRGRLRALGTWLAEGGRDIVTGIISGMLTGG